MAIDRLSELLGYGPTSQPVANIGVGSVPSYRGGKSPAETAMRNQGILPPEQAAADAMFEFDPRVQREMAAEMGRVTSPEQQRVLREYAQRLRGYDTPEQYAAAMVNPSLSRPAAQAAPQMAVPVAQRAAETAPNLADLIRSIPIQPSPKTGSRDFATAGSDTLRGLASGVGGLIKSGGSLYGLVTGDMDNSATQFGDDVQNYWENGQSDYLKAKRAGRQAEIAAADGIGGKAWAALKGTLTDPALAMDAAATNVANLIPGMGAGRLVAGAKYASNMGRLAAGGGVVAEEAARLAALNAGKWGTAAAVGAGAVQQGGDVSSDAYDLAMKKPNEVWAQNPEFMAALQQELQTNPDAEAAVNKVKQAFATQVARATFLPGTALSVAANAIPGATLLERGLVGGAAREGKKMGLTRSIVQGVLGEAGQEALEEGGGAFAGNVARKMIVDPNQDLSEKVGEQAGMGAAGGALFGVHGGIMHRNASAPIAPPPQGQKIEAGGALDLTTSQGFEPAPARPSQPVPLADPTDHWRTTPGAAPENNYQGAISPDGLHDFNTGNLSLAPVGNPVDLTKTRLAQPVVLGDTGPAPYSLDDLQLDSRQQPAPYAIHGLQLPMESQLELYDYVRQKADSGAPLRPVEQHVLQTFASTPNRNATLDVPQERPGFALSGHPTPQFALPVQDQRPAFNLEMQEADPRQGELDLSPAPSQVVQKTLMDIAAEHNKNRGGQMQLPFTANTASPKGQVLMPMIDSLAAEGHMDEGTHVQAATLVAQGKFAAAQKLVEAALKEKNAADSMLDKMQQQIDKHQARVEKQTARAEKQAEKAAQQETPVESKPAAPSPASESSAPAERPSVVRKEPKPVAVASKPVEVKPAPAPVAEKAPAAPKGKPAADATPVDAKQPASKQDAVTDIPPEFAKEHKALLNKIVQYEQFLKCLAR